MLSKWHLIASLPGPNPDVSLDVRRVDSAMVRSLLFLSVLLRAGKEGFLLAGHANVPRIVQRASWKDR